MVLQVLGEKDTDGFYRAEVCGRRGLIPCNMVSEIHTDDDEMIDQLLKQGFLPLNTPIEKIGMNLFHSSLVLASCHLSLLYCTSFPLICNLSSTPSTPVRESIYF